MNGNEVNTIETEFSKSADSGVQEGMLLSPGAEALLFDDNGSALPGPASSDRNMKHVNNGYIYIEKERLILTNFRNFLVKLAYGNMEGRLCASSEIQ